MANPMYGTQPIYGEGSPYGMGPGGGPQGSRRVLGQGYGQSNASSVDWASFDPGQWWQTSGLDPSWFHEFGAFGGGPGTSWGLAPPSGAIERDWLSLDPAGYPTVTGPEGRFDPLAMYQDYWAQGDKGRATLDEPFRGRGRDVKGGSWGPFEPLEIPGIPEEDLARFQQWIDEVSGSLEARLQPGYSIWDPELTARMEERASPEYTAWSPEQRGAIAENIGGQLALAKRGISEQMGQRGIRGSGLEAQLGMTAAGQAARGMGDIRAALASSDEATRTAALQSLTQMQAADESARQWATQQLEGVRQFGLTGLQGQTTDAQNMLLNFAQMTGYPVMMGAEQQIIDPFGLTETGRSMQDFKSTLLMNYLLSEEGGGLADYLSLIGGIGGVEHSGLQMLIGAGGLSEFGR